MPDTESESGPESFQTSHIYDDGNILLDVRGTLFKVHRSILSVHSETFRDMFSLPQVCPATDNQNEPLALDDPPQAFDNLMNAVYKGVQFLHSTSAQQCLGVIELTRKYQMDALEANLQQHLVSLLPSSTAEILALDLERFTPYLDDPPLARDILRLGAKELWPWAFYIMGTRMISTVNVDEKSAYDPPQAFLNLDSSFTYSLLVLLQLIRRSLEKWHEQIGKFYLTGCHKATGTTTPRCSRHGRKFDNTSPLYIDLISGDGRLFIIGVTIRSIERLIEIMENEDDSDHGRWCAKCRSSLKKIATDIVLEFYQGLVECTARMNCSSL